jgi:FkbM family methyltransferase
MPNYKGQFVYSDEELPKLAIITPCYERQHFLPLMICNIINFDYPKEKMEWVILQDGPSCLFGSEEREEEVREKIAPIKLNYKFEKDIRRTIGDKRNRCIKMSSAKYSIMMDSDDIYFTTYPRYAVSTLKKNKLGIVGSQQMIFIYPFHNYEMAGINCPAKRQIHEGTSCIERKHFHSTKGFKKTSQGEGIGLLDSCESRAKHLEIELCMVCVDHGHNTIPKEMFRKQKLEGAKLEGVHMNVLKLVMKLFEYKENWIPYEIFNEKGELVETSEIENTEQDMVEKYVKPHHSVFELGARYGSVSCKANRILTNKKNQVSVEPDSRVWSALERNKSHHNCEFHIIKGFCSTKKMSLTNLDECVGGYGCYAIDDPKTTIPSWTLDEIKEQTGIKNFDVLIADCEGYLLDFFEENPTFYDEIELISFESDRDDVLDYSPIFTTLEEKGFHKVEQLRNIYTFKRITTTATPSEPDLLLDQSLEVCETPHNLQQPSDL